MVSAGTCGSICDSMSCKAGETNTASPRHFYANEPDTVSYARNGIDLPNPAARERRGWPGPLQRSSTKQDHDGRGGGAA